MNAIYTTFFDTELADQNNIIKVLEAALAQAAECLAKEFVKRHGQEVLAKMDVQALANLAIIRSVPELKSFLK